MDTRLVLNLSENEYTLIFRKRFGSYALRSGALYLKFDDFDYIPRDNFDSELRLLEDEKHICTLSFNTCENDSDNEILEFERALKTLARWKRNR